MPVYKVDFDTTQINNNFQQSAPLQRPANHNPPAVVRPSRVIKTKWPRWAMSRMNVEANTVWSVMQMMAIAATIGWLVACATYIYRHLSAGGVISPFEAATILMGVFAPPALLWGALAFFERGRFIRAALTPFIRQLDMMIYPSKESEARVKKITESLRVQANELLTATLSAERTLEKARKQLRQDMEAASQWQDSNLTRITSASEMVHQRSLRLADLSKDTRETLEVIEDRFLVSGASFETSMRKVLGETRDAAHQFEEQLSAPIVRLEEANRRIQTHADGMTANMQNVAQMADKTIDRYDRMVAGLTQNNEVMGSAANRIESQMERVNGVFAVQLQDMGRAIERFGAVGNVIANASRDFRSDAEEVVEEAALQMGQLSDTLDQKMTETRALLENVIKTAKDGAKETDDRLENGLTELREALSKTAETTPQILQTILDQITGRLEEFELRFSHSTLTTGQVFEKLQDQLENRVAQLGTMAEDVGQDITHHVTGAMNTMAYRMRVVRDGFSNSLSDSNRELSSFQNELAHTIEALAVIGRKTAEKTVRRITEMNGMIAENLNRLRTTSDRVAAQSAKSQQRLESQIGMLQATGDDYAERADTMYNQANAYSLSVEEAARNISGLMDGFVSNVSGKYETLQNASLKASTELEESARTLLDRQAEFYASVANTSYDVKKMAHDVDQYRYAIDDTSEAVKTVIGAAASQMAGYAENGQRFEEQSARLIATLQTQSEVIEQGASSLAERSGVMQDILQTSALDLVAATEKVGGKTEEVRQSLRRQIYDVATQMGEITAQTEELTEKLNHQRGAVTAASQDLQGVSEQMQQALQQEVAAIRDTSTNALQNTQELIAGLRRDQEGVIETADNVAARVNSAADQYKLLIQQMQAQTGKVENTIYAASDKLLAREQELKELSQQTERAAQRATGEMESAALKFAEESRQAEEIWSGMNTEMKNSIGTLNLGTENAVDQLRNLTRATVGTLAEVSMAANAAEENLTGLQQSLNGSQDNMQLLVAQSARAVEQMQQNFGAQVAELSEATATINKNLEHSGQTIAAQVEKIAQNGNLMQHQWQDNLLIAEQQVNQMRDALNNSLQHFELMSQSLQTQMEDIASSGNKNARALGDETEALARRHDASLTNVLTLQHELLSLQQRMENELNALNALKNQVKQELQQSTEELETRSRRLEESAGEATRMMTTASDRFALQTDAVQKKSAEVRQAGENLMEQFSLQIRQFDQVMQQATSKTEQFHAKEIRSRRDAFLNAAKFVLETLHSLSIDLTRVLDSESAEKLWKGFYKGDTTIFTRRMLNLKDTLPAEKVQSMYETSSEFRAYVQRYRRQFDELMEQAKEVDHADLLTTMLMTSDIGKIHLFLTSALADAGTQSQQKAA